MAIKLTLSAEEILRKVFKISPKGYDALEVDEYLDRVLRDYRTIEANYLLEGREVDTLKSRIAKLENEKSLLEIENTKYKNRLSNIKDNDNVTEANIDLVKKINAYEKFLWNHGFNPNTIK